MDLRCPSGILHGIIDVESDVIEFTCKSNRCGHAPGVVVLHTFNIHTGEIETTRYAELVRKEGHK
jgi:hypothetical protein